MVLQGWDLNSSPITNATPLLLSCGWWRFWFKYTRFYTKMECGWIDSTISQHLSPSNFSLYLWWMVREGWDWCMCSIMVTTTCFWGAGGVKVGFALIHFWHQDCVILDWFRQFTASQPFQCLIVSIMNGFARLRFEFITHNQCHTPTFELWVVTISAQVH